MTSFERAIIAVVTIWCIICTLRGIFLARDLKEEKEKTANAEAAGKEEESELLNQIKVLEEQIEALEAEKIQIGREVIQLKDELAKFNGAENTECDHFVDEVKPKKSRSANGRFSKQ